MFNEVAGEVPHVYIGHQIQSTSRREVAALCRAAEAHVAPAKVLPINWAEMPSSASLPTTAPTASTSLAATPHDDDRWGLN